MNLDEFRIQMFEYRLAADEEATSLKDSFFVLVQLQALYRKFDAEERTMANQVLSGWALSDDEKVRFDALALIDDFKVVVAIFALQELSVRLESACTPSAPYELLKVNRIIRGLSSQGAEII